MKKCNLVEPVNSYEKMIWFLSTSLIYCFFVGPHHHLPHPPHHHLPLPHLHPHLPHPSLSVRTRRWYCVLLLSSIPSLIIPLTCLTWWGVYLFLETLCSPKDPKVLPRHSSFAIHHSLLFAICSLPFAIFIILSGTGDNVEKQIVSLILKRATSDSDDCIFMKQFFN